MQAPNSAGKTAKIITAAILAVVGIAGSLKLNFLNIISEPTLVLFTAFSLVVGLVIAFIERIESFSLRSLGVKLKEIHETEESVNQIGPAIYDVFETKSHGLMLQSYNADAADATMERLERLVDR